MGTELNIDTSGNSVEKPYPLSELAKKGIISANGWEKVSVQGSYYNKDLRVSLIKP